MVQGIRGLDSLGELARSEKPSEFDFILYLFWDNGIGFSEFCNLPLPYIFSVLKTHTYIKKEEEKAYKKAKRK